MSEQENKRKRGRPRKEKPTLEQLHILFLENYENIKEQLFEAHPDLWTGCAAEALHRVAFLLPKYKGTAKAFPAWASAQVLKEVSCTMYMEPSRAQWLRGLKLDLPLSGAAFSPACKAILAGVNSVRQSPSQWIHDNAVSNHDLYQRACQYLCEHCDLFMSEGTAKLETRLHGLGASTARQYYRSYVNRRWNSVQRGEELLRENFREVISIAELAERKAEKTVERLEASAA